MVNKRFLLTLGAVLLCGMLILTACSDDAGGDSEGTTNDHPPMVMFDNSLYSAASVKNIIDLETVTLENVGEITSYIADGIPSENNQANDDLVGCEIYASQELTDYIFVLYNGDYSPYKKQTN